jgi:hypothetical protein
MKEEAFYDPTNEILRDGVHRPIYGVIFLPKGMGRGAIYGQTR